MSAGTVLIVEDNKDLVQMLEYNLAQRQYTPLAAFDGLTACRMIEEEKPDLILLDLMLPDLNGWEICKMVRSHKYEEISETPIIMLTALDSPGDKLKGLELGADDYIPKPFAIKEVLLKVARQIRKSRTNQQLNTKIKELEWRQRNHKEFQEILFHELRNQLLVIKGFSSRISKKQGVAPGRYRSYAGVIEKSSGFLYSMAEEIILLSKLEIGEYPLPFEEICMEETIRQIISIFFRLAKEKDISIRFEKAGEAPKIRLNLAALKICLSNLIENAIKYSPPKTCVRVNLLCRKEKTVVLKIKDSGPGIPKEEMENIFKKFYRARNIKDKTKGTGLGLYITKSLVEKMGGTIRVFNGNRAGCCFEITYPTH